MIDEKKLIEQLEKHKRTWTLFASGLHIAIEDIKRQPKVSEWIPVSKGLPEDETLSYWTTHEDGSLVMHGYTKRNGFINNWEVDDLEKRKRQGQVIAWMPIFKPEPYKEEVKE